MKKYSRYIFAYGLAFLISLVGIIWQMNAPSQTALIILAALSAVPILLFTTNILLSKLYVRKIRHTRVADMNEYMLRHKSEAEIAERKLLRKLQRQRRLATVFAIFVWLLGACAALLGGMLYTLTSSLLLLAVLYGGTVFYAVYSRIPNKEPVTLNENALVLQREEYPILYGLAERAAQTLDCPGSITILLSFDCNASILRDGKKYYLQLGVVLLNVLSEEELYCICLHEFSHCTKKTQEARREVQYGFWISSDRNLPPRLFFVTNLFALFDAHYVFNHMIYQYATSVVNETAADRDMARHGTPAVAASALLKINYDDKFRWETGTQNEEPTYAAEKPNPHFIREQIERFKTAIEKRHKDWDEMLAHEIQPNNASHPIFRMRLETLGVKSAKQIEDRSSSAYKKETENALNFADRNLCERQDMYEQYRKESYLDPLERVTEWEKSGMPVTAEGFADIVSDLKQLGRHEDAEALCDRAMQELDVNSSPHAYFIKGCTLIHRYDEAGIDLIYHALEMNHNYLEEGLLEIGEFCCITGREKELQIYRERAEQLAQKDVDEYSETGTLSKNDRLSGEHLPDGMLEEILSYIRSIDEDIIQNVYLVRKTINDSFFTSAFVIHFYGGTDAQHDAIMHKIFRYLDTYPVDWQFSLFNYFDHLDIKFDKIEGSLVYSKNSKG